MLNELLALLTDPSYRFFQYALWGGLLASVPFGVVGTYVVTRRITGIAGAIAHCVLAGIGVALYAQRTWDLAWCDPVLGALLSAFIAAFILGIIGRKGYEREDTLIGALWAVGMSIGLMFLSKTPGFVDPMVYLFGNILLLSEVDLYIIGALDISVIAIAFLLYQPLLAVCFDEEMARLRGLPVVFLYSLLLILTALTVVLLIRVVGIVLVIALLTLPAAIAGQVTHKLWQMMLFAIILSMFFVMGGLGLSYTENLPTGPTIVLLAAALYLATMGISWAKRRFRKASI